MSDQDVLEHQERETSANLATARQRGLVALVAILVAQAAWILAVPPFRGNDEIDHAYRAAAVAAGEWHLSEGTNQGRGILAWVPRDLQQAAEPQCEAQRYAGAANCRPVASRGSQVQVATASGNYDPFFYWVIGTAAKPFAGAASLYVMRIATAMITALLLALGVGLIAYAGAGRWATLGVLTAIVPQVLYSGAIAAPNGPEMGLGLVLWSSLLALDRRRGQGAEPALLAIATAAAMPLAFIRFLGPVWIVCIVLSAIALRGLKPTWELVQRRRRSIVLAVLGVGLATCWWATWMVISRDVHMPAGTPYITTPASFGWSDAVFIPLWSLQAVAAFPYRDVPAPMAVYALEFLVIGYLLWAAWRRGNDLRRARVLLVVVVASFLIPVVLTLTFASVIGTGWQGRYELPFLIGILPLCGLMLDRADYQPHFGRRSVMTGAGSCLVVSQVWCVVHVEHLEFHRLVSVNDTSWIHPAPWVVGLIMLAACGIAASLFREAPAVARPPYVGTLGGRLVDADREGRL